jgi:hypothetical protein
MRKQDDAPGGSARSIPCSSAEAATLSELQVIDMLGDLGVTHAALRAAASADEALMGSADRPLYPQAYIEDIRDNWTPKREAKLMLGMTDHQFWHWLNLSGRKARLIGKVSLVRRSEVWDELKKRALRETA